MIKIIKKGKPKQLTCKVCNCLFEYEEEDTIFRGCIKIIKCPQCKTIINAYSGIRY